MSDHSAEIDEILRYIDPSKTTDNPDGNPFLPGGISKAQAKAALQSIIAKAEVAGRIDELERLHTEDIKMFGIKTYEYAENRLTQLRNVEVITRYAKGEPDMYSLDGGETYITREEFDRLQALKAQGDDRG